MSTVSSSPIATCLSLTRALGRAVSPEDIYAAALDVLAQSVGVSRAAILLFDADGVMRCPESGHRYQETAPGVLQCLDLHDDAPLPETLRTGTRSYREWKTEVPR